jgi:hypothetical protein
VSRKSKTPHQADSRVVVGSPSSIVFLRENKSDSDFVAEVWDDFQHALEEYQAQLLAEAIGEDLWW